MDTIEMATDEDSGDRLYLHNFLKSIENLAIYWEHLNLIDRRGFAY